MIDSIVIDIKRSNQNPFTTLQLYTCPFIKGLFYEHYNEVMLALGDFVKAKQYFTESLNILRNQLQLGVHGIQAHPPEIGLIKILISIEEMHGAIDHLLLSFPGTAHLSYLLLSPSGGSPGRTHIAIGESLYGLSLWHYDKGSYHLSVSLSSILCHQTKSSWFLSSSVTSQSTAPRFTLLFTSELFSMLLCLLSSHPSLQSHIFHSPDTHRRPHPPRDDCDIS
jgi:hypothetical protein